MKEPAAKSPDDSRYILGETNSYVEPVVGVNPNSSSTSIDGVFQPVFAITLLSAIFPDAQEALSIILILNPIPSPLFASWFTPTDAGNAVERVILVVVEPTAIVPVGQALGRIIAKAPAPKTPVKAGEITGCHSSVTFE